jgi:hypothetical protein
VEWIELHRNQAVKALENLWMIRRIGIRPGPGLAFALRGGPRLAAEIHSMYQEMHTLENLPKGSPTLTMARRMHRVRQSDDLFLTEVDHLGFLIYTWNSWVAGKPRTKLQRPTGGWSADNFPKVDF